MVLGLCVAAAERPPSSEVISELKQLQRLLGFQLRLAKGTRRGCRLDENNHDIFFYPIEAVASGDAPVTASLELRV